MSFRAFLAAVWVVLTVPCIASASEEASGQIDETGASANGARWFSDIGVGLRFGASFQQRSVNNGDFPSGYVVGPELSLQVLSLGIHRFLITGGFLYFEHRLEKGTEQIRIKTNYRRLDATVGYDIAWKWLVAGLRVGGAFTIINITTIYGEPGWQLETDDNGEYYVKFSPPEDPDFRKHSGIDPGFLAGLGFGLALGEYLFGIPDLVELRAQSDYVRRGTRNEFTVWGMICFWPMRNY